MQSRIVGAISGGIVGGFLVGRSSLVPTVHNEEKVLPPKYPWSHLGLFSSYDHARYEQIGINSF
jgi:hypothetical protein